MLLFYVSSDTKRGMWKLEIERCTIMINFFNCYYKHFFNCHKYLTREKGKSNSYKGLHKLHKKFGS